MEGLVRYRSAVIIGGLLWILCLILGISWQYITTIIVKSSLSLSPSSIGFQMWRETPIPMYMEFYLFNWTNPDKVKAGLEKPHVQQLGPYTYREKHTRVNMTWHLQNDSITYRQFKEWHFVPSMSSGTEEDRIVSLNVMAATIADKVKNYNGVVKRLVSIFLDAVESLAINRSAREWLFDGFSDPVLNIAKMLDKNKILNISIPFDKFGWFYSRNMSASYDGVFNLYTGQQSLSNLGNVHSWNYATHTLYFNDSCGDVKGSTGELIHPLVDDTTLTIFSNDLCSFLTLSKSEGKIEKYGIEGVRFEGDISEFDNGTLYPKHKCFTYNGKAMPNGVRDMSKCRFGAPAYVSFPHFLDADSWYVDSVVGMKPNKTEHNFFISVEPNTGLPLDVRAQMQINILLQPVKGMSMFAKVPRVVMPMFFFRQTAELTPDLSSKLKLLLNLPLIGYLTFFGFFVLLSLVFAVFLKVTWRLDKDDNVDDDDESLIISAEEPSNSESVQQISQ